jgi:uncharacterized RDD family membrane protein YckC
VNDLVTGDAVVLELRLAKLASRAVAFGIDVLVMLTGFGVLLLALSGLLAAEDGALVATVTLVLVVGVFVGYPVALETLTRGRTLGKMTMGLRVVRDDGGPTGFRQALARGLAGFVVDFGILSLFTGAIGLITSLASSRGRRVGDVLAGTVVVRERVPTADAAPVAMPPPLAAWATNLELSRLPDTVALSVRQYLQRAGQLDPRVRGSLGASLAIQVGACVSPPPPPGTPAEPYLAAVLAERRRREEARLAGQQPVPTLLTGRPTAPWSSAPPAPPRPDRDTDPPPQDGFVLPR